MLAALPGRRTVFGLVAVFLLLAASRAAGAQDGNFAIPEATPKAATLSYKQGLELFESADRGGEGATARAIAAAERFRAAARLAPKFALPRYYLGIIYQWTKEFERAKTTLRQAVGLSRSFHEAHVELGDTYMWLKQPKKALVWYDRALKAQPDYGLAYLRRGQLHMRQGKFLDAKADFDKAAALTKDPRELAGVSQYLAMCQTEIAGPQWPTVYASETKNYRVLTPVNQALADNVSHHAELIFKTYRKIFPAVKRARRKFTILVYGSAEEYHANGGPKSAGGHYSPLVRKLVLFRYPKEEDMLIVLYHEAFHQFLHDYLEDAPQWMDEGLGDFFGPSRYLTETNARGKVVAEGMQVKPNPWRLRTIQRAIRRGRIRRWKELMLMSQAELYEDSWAGIHYAQSWSIIYFLVRAGAKGDQLAGPYFKLLKAYFNALRKGEGQESAFESAFGKADLEKLEGEWKRFVLGVKR